MIIRQIHCIERLEYINKVGKYVADLQFNGYPKGTFWLTVKQAKRLNDDMGNSDYSTKKNVVWCTIDDSGDNPRYVWSGRNQPGYDWLKSKFGDDDE